MPKAETYQKFALKWTWNDEMNDGVKWSGQKKTNKSENEFGRNDQTSNLNLQIGQL